MPARRSWGVVADFHMFGEGSAVPGYDEKYRIMQEIKNAPGLDGIISLGDCDLGRLREFIYSDCGVPSHVWVRGVLGNWDSDYPTNHPCAEESVENPFASTVDAEDYFDGNEWWVHNDENVLLVGIQTNSPSEHPDTQKDNAHNCNPPGACTLNPDWSGVTDPNSSQRSAVNLLIDNSMATFKIVFMHTPAWATYDGPGRPMNRDLRSWCGEMQDRGVLAFNGGHLHVGSLVGEIDSLDGNILETHEGGCVHLTITGGSINRQPDPSLIEEDILLWSSPHIPHMCQGAIYTIGNACRLRVIEARPGEDVQQVWAGFLGANPGVGQ